MSKHRPRSPEARPDKRQHLHLQQVSALGMLAVGAIIALCGFWATPRGTIHESVLWIFAQCLIYAGSIMGVGSYLQMLADNLRHRPRH